jgi:hypothetical protein
METNNALQEVFVAPSLSKATQASVVADLVAQVKNGNVDPMKAFIQVKAIAEICKQFLEDVDVVSATMTAVGKAGKEVPDFNGAKVGLTNTTRYDYDACFDSEYAKLVALKETIATKIKAREMFLKTIEDSIDFVDKETGEMRTIFAPEKTTSKSLRVTFAKV